MKADRRVSRKTLFTADEVARAAKVDGRGRMMTVDGAERLAVETNSRVSLKLAKGDLSAYNVLVVNLLGILPLEPLSEVLHLPRIGGVATSIPTVAGGLASLSLLTIIALGVRASAARCRR